MNTRAHGGITGFCLGWVLAGTLLTLEACGWDKPLPVTPTAGYPCGVTGVACGGGLCCAENEVCGGGAFAGCPAAACCDVGGGAYGGKAKHLQTAAKP